MNSLTQSPQWPLGRAASLLASCLALGATLGVPPAWAAEAPASAAAETAALQQLRATTLALIEALVSQGLLTRERADALLRPATVASGATTPPAAATPAWGTPRAEASPQAPVVRVPYISETTRRQIANEVRKDVLDASLIQGWAKPNTVPSWLSGVTISGDVRVRVQQDNFDGARYLDADAGLCDIVGGNLPAPCYRAQGASPAWSPDLSNTTNDRDRLTLRARLGVEAKVSDETRLGLRLSTGSTSGPTSSSATLGNGFNKQTVVLDRAFVRWAPREDLRLLAGRMANPFFGGGLLWPDDLGFDGLALQGELGVTASIQAFGTLGAFPLQELSVGSRDKWLYALQLGADGRFGASSQWRLGLAVYQFADVEGVRETQPAPTGALAGTTDYLSSQYPANLRLKGNTLINLNDPTSTAAPTWGLASKFRPLNLSTQVRTQLDETLGVGFSLDWVHNAAFDVADIRRRAGTDAVLQLVERNTGLQMRLDFGRASVASAGDWQVFATWRRFERDAWIDGFTDTSWHGGGGTNYQGWQLGGLYAFDKRTSLGLRATTTRNLSDGQINLSSAPLKVDVMQLDLSTRF